MQMSDHRATVITYQGADGRPLEFTVRNSDGTATDLTGFSVFLSASHGDDAKISRAEMTVSDPTAGEVSYLPSAAEISDVGVYDAQLRLVNAGGLIDYTEPVRLDVRAPIDNV